MVSRYCVSTAAAIASPVSKFWRRPYGTNWRANDHRNCRRVSLRSLQERTELSVRKPRARSLGQSTACQMKAIRNTVISTKRFVVWLWSHTDARPTRADLSITRVRLRVDDIWMAALLVTHWMLRVRSDTATINSWLATALASGESIAIGTVSVCPPVSIFTLYFEPTDIWPWPWHLYGTRSSPHHSSEAIESQGNRWWLGVRVRATRTMRPRSRGICLLVLLLYSQRRKLDPRSFWFPPKLPEIKKHADNGPVFYAARWPSLMSRRFKNHSQTVNKLVKLLQVYLIDPHNNYCVNTLTGQLVRVGVASCSFVQL